MFTLDKYRHVTKSQQITVNGNDYIITKGRKGYYIFALGALIPSMIPGRASGPERYAQCLNDTSNQMYRNQYKSYYLTKPIPTAYLCFNYVGNGKDVRFRNSDKGK